MSEPSLTAALYGLELNARGTHPLSNLANAVTTLQKDPLWSPTRFWYDEFLDRVLMANSPTREWRDDDDTALTVYLQQAIGMTTIAETHAAAAVRHVARQRTRHCVREYLSGLQWDDEPRMESAFERYWGAAVSIGQTQEYLRAASRNWFLSLVARIHTPGCKADCMPVFEGKQGIGKERALVALGGAWYMFAREEVTHKDFFQNLPGKWMIEIGEMHAFGRAMREQVKTAISTRTDRYRESYGRRSSDHPRQCIFAGTTNEDEWGNDDTGMRRFWPVRCGVIDVDALAADRDQLFAEAWVRLLRGESWWLMPASTVDAQRERLAEDIWTPVILEWLVRQSVASLTTAEVLRGALSFRDLDMNRMAQLRAGSILRLAGWKHQTVRRHGDPLKAWTPPSDT